MNDAPPIPRGFRAKIRWVVDHHPWIWLLVGVEQFSTEHYSGGFVFLAIFAANLFIWEAWDGIFCAARKVKGRNMAFTFIIIGAICLSVGIAILATSSEWARGLTPSVSSRATSAPIAPTSLSDDEKYFRLALRKFVLSNVGELNQSFGYALSIPNELRNDISNHRSNLSQAEQEKVTDLLDMYDETLKLQFFGRAPSLIESANNNIEDINPAKLADSIKYFFDGYRSAQSTFKRFIRISGVNPTNTDVIQKWMDADARASNALRDLKAFPESTLLKIDEGYFPTLTGSFAQFFSNSGAKEENKR
jgi:hypothetical protein